MQERISISMDSELIPKLKTESGKRILSLSRFIEHVLLGIINTNEFEWVREK